MRQSKFFIKTIKNLAKDEVSINAKLLISAGFIDKLTAGVYTLLPLGLKVMTKIEDVIREEMNQIGGQEIFMPTLQPKEIWMKTGRWETMNDLYRLKDKSEREFALGPTHEEVVVPLVKKFVTSYKDLPFYVYQFQNKFRMELRPKSGILRTKEFMMKDLYSFHLTEEDLDHYYQKVEKAYFKIFARVGLKDKTYLTFASGGSFSKYSHEFQIITPAGEDTIYICQNCRLAINKEIKSQTEKCPGCGQSEFKQEKSIEVGNIFPLKTKFSKPFDFSVTDRRGKRIEVIMGCYGIGLGRLMGTIVEVLHDDRGIIWPETVAPYQVHLLSLGQDDETEKIYNELQGKGIEVLFDDRDLSAGEKFVDADLIGCPQRVIVSQKTLKANKVEVKLRREVSSRLIGLKEFIGKILKN